MVLVSYFKERGLMMNLIKIFFFCIFGIGAAFAGSDFQKWGELSLDEQADILYELDYLEDGTVPGTTVVNLVSSGKVSFLDIQDIEQRKLAEKIIIFFEREVDRESIDQSPYATYGEPRLVGFYFLLNSLGQVLAGSISFFQDGRDEDGEEADINWRASMRFDSEGKPFVNENGEYYDDLRFEWSGH